MVEVNDQNALDFMPASLLALVKVSLLIQVLNSFLLQSMLCPFAEFFEWCIWECNLADAEM